MHKTDEQLRVWAGELGELKDSLEPSSDEFRRLSEIVKDIELASGPDNAVNGPLIEQIKELAVQVEVEHPRLTNILNDLMVTLSGMGV